MKTRKRDHSLGEGVYYAADDYIGIGRRIVLICVDLTVIILGGVVLAWTLATVDAEGSERSMMRAALYSWLLYVALVAAYMTVIKASKIRTIGYRVAGTKIVDLRGRRPSIAAASQTAGISPGNATSDTALISLATVSLLPVSTPITAIRKRSCRGIFSIFRCRSARERPSRTTGTGP